MALPASWPVSDKVVSGRSVEKALTYHVDDRISSFSTGATGAFIWVDGVYTRVGGVYATQ